MWFIGFKVLQELLFISKNSKLLVMLISAANVKRKHYCETVSELAKATDRSAILYAVIVKFHEQLQET